ncbi:MAG: T9SS type A sorting domain-containing protein, partial [Bacteroidales bacterium]
VHITPAQNGSFTVKNGSKTIHNGDLVDSNTRLQLVAIPEKGYVFDQWWDKDTLATKEYILKSSVSISALFKKGLAVEEEQGKLNIRTYTNNQIIYIELPGEESYLVEIYDLQGRRIHFQKNAMHTINFPINSKGTYILRVRNATEKWVQKIIVS